MDSVEQRLTASAKTSFASNPHVRQDSKSENRTCCRTKWAAKCFHQNVKLSSDLHQLCVLLFYIKKSRYCILCPINPQSVHLYVFNLYIIRQNQRHSRLTGKFSVFGVLVFYRTRVGGTNVNSTLPDGTPPRDRMISRAAPEFPPGNAPRPSGSADETDSPAADGSVTARRPAK